MSEIAKRDAEIERFRGLLRALVDDIAEIQSCGLNSHAFGFAMHRENCPQCEEHPDELVIVCPYHAAKAALEET